MGINYKQWRSEVKWRPWQRRNLRPPPPFLLKICMCRGKAARKFFSPSKDWELRGAQNYHLGAQFFTNFFPFFSPFSAPPLRWRPWHVPSLPSPHYATDYKRSPNFFKQAHIPHVCTRILKQNKCKIYFKWMPFLIWLYLCSSSESMVIRMQNGHGLSFIKTNQQPTTELIYCGKHLRTGKEGWEKKYGKQPRTKKQAIREKESQSLSFLYLFLTTRVWNLPWAILASSSPVSSCYVAEYGRGWWILQLSWTKTWPEWMKNAPANPK